VFPLLLIWSFTRPLPQYTSLTSSSPDDQQTVELYETPEGGFPSDRQFQIVLYPTTNTNRYKILFHSPDEGAPGTERFVWSTDSRYFLLLGGNFAAFTNAPLARASDRRSVYGYLLYDTISKKAFCNSAQSGRFPPFYIADLESKNFDQKTLDAAIADAQRDPPKR
jgi:hypothetical protein